MIASVLRGKPTAKGVTYLASHTNIDFSTLISCTTEFQQLEKVTLLFCQMFIPLTSLQQQHYFKPHTKLKTLIVAQRLEKSGIITLLWFAGYKLKFAKNSQH